MKCLLDTNLGLYGFAAYKLRRVIEGHGLLLLESTNDGFFQL